MSELFLTSDAEGNMPLSEKSVMLFVVEPHRRWKNCAVNVDVNWQNTKFLSVDAFSESV